LKTAAWYFALCQIAIETIGTVGGFIIRQMKVPQADKADYEAYSAEYEKAALMSSDVDATLGGLTPKIPQNTPGSGMA